MLGGNRARREFLGLTGAGVVGVAAGQATLPVSAAPLRPVAASQYFRREPISATRSISKAKSTFIFLEVRRFSVRMHPLGEREWLRSAGSK